MFRRCAAGLLLAAFFLSCGGHWYVLQGVAWVNMVRDYSTIVPVATAVQMTLSGQYPCKICKIIAEKKQQENDRQDKLPVLKKDFFAPVLAVVTAPASRSLEWEIVSTEFPARDFAPPTPPPRLPAS